MKYSDDGSALALVPAAILVSLLLLGVAVDSALTLNAQRKLTDVADLAALDIANTALDQEYFASHSTSDNLALRLDSSRARQIAEQFEADVADDGYLSDVHVTVDVESATSVTVTIEARRKRLIPLAGAPKLVDLQAHARAELRIVD